MKKYDVVVVGAGNGGLAAAVKILNAGKSCLVLEKQSFFPSSLKGKSESDKSLFCLFVSASYYTFHTYRQNRALSSFSDF